MIAIQAHPIYSHPMTDSLKLYSTNPIREALERAYRSRISSHDRLAKLSEDVIHEILTEPTEYGKGGNASIKAELAFKVHKMHVAEQPQHNINQNLQDEAKRQIPIEPLMVTRDEAMDHMSKVLKLEQETMEWKARRIAERDEKAQEIQEVNRHGQPTRQLTVIGS